MDLPSREEREEIFKIQLSKHKREVANFDITRLAIESDGYTGAEIEECVVSAMFDAWFEAKREPRTEDIINSMKAINPMSKGMMQTQVDSLRKWSKEASIRMANGTVPDSEAHKPQLRKIFHGGEDD